MARDGSGLADITVIKNECNCCQSLFGNDLLAVISHEECDIVQLCKTCLQACIDAIEEKEMEDIQNLGEGE